MNLHSKLGSDSLRYHDWVVRVSLRLHMNYIRIPQLTISCGRVKNFLRNGSEKISFIFRD